MASTMSTRRDRAASSTLSFFETFADDIGSGIDQRLLPHWKEGETPVDFRLALRALGRLVQASLEDALVADQENACQLDKAAACWQEVEEASQEVHSNLLLIRRLFKGFFGRAGAKEKLGLDGRTPAQATLLLREGKHLLRRLRRLMKLKGTGGRIKGCRVNPGALADDLAPGVERLDRADKELQRVQRKLEASQIAKSDANRLFDVDYRDSVSLAKALCRMARRPELAKQLSTSFYKE